MSPFSLKKIKIPSKIKKRFLLFFSDKIIEEIAILTFLFNIFIWIFVFVKIEDFNLLVPLQFDLWGGVTRMGKAKEIFYYPLLGLLIFFIDLFLAFFVFPQKENLENKKNLKNQILKERFFSYFILGVAFLIQIFLFLFLYHLLNNI